MPFPSLSPRHASLSRQILRAGRKLGPHWKAITPAVDTLWGQGLLGSRRPFAPWLRSALRRSGLAASDLDESVGSINSLEREGKVLQFLQAQEHLSTVASSSKHKRVCVDAVSGLVKASSDLSKGHFVFSYNMRFTNVGCDPVRILSREYVFRDDSGALVSEIREDDPRAAGIVGCTPVLQPGGSFEFGSGVVLHMARGSVVGRFLAMVEPELVGENAKLHSEMSQAELMLRFLYFKGLETEQFHVPIGQLQFDADVPCVSFPNGAQSF